MLKREWGAESNGKLRTYSIPGKTSALVPEFTVGDLSSAELQPRFLRLQRRTCPWAEHSDDDFIDIIRGFTAPRNQYRLNRLLPVSSAGNLMVSKALSLQP